MAFITKAAFAKEAGVNRTLIYRMVAEQKLTVRPDGKLDTEDQTNKNYLNKKERPDGAKTSDIKKATKKNTVKPITNKPKTEEDNIPDDLGDNGQVKIYEGMDISTLSKYDLERYHKMVSIKEKEIKNRIAENIAIDRNLVVRFVNSLYQIDVNNFLQLSRTVSVTIASEIFKTNDPEKVTAVEKVVTEATYKTQEYIQREVTDFLNEIDPKNKKEIKTA